MLIIGLIGIAIFTLTSSTPLEHREALDRTNLEDLKIRAISHTHDTCQISGKNNVTTKNLPDERLYEMWREQQIIDKIITVTDGEMRLVSAFVYLDHVAVVISMFGRENVSRPVTCHYFDCNRNHIGSYESRIFPVAAVRCVRKFGAEFISITLAGEDLSARDPIVLTDRTATQPPHEVGVCVGQIYGETTRFVDVLETVEHHRMIDCYFRSRMHSKWVINIDIDERFLMKNPTNLPSFLGNLPIQIVGISFPVARIQVEDSGIQFGNQTFFEKYRKMSRPFWDNHKSIYQHQYSHVPFYHWAWRITPGKMVMTFNSTIGYFRHYRLTSSKHIGSNWLDYYAPFAKNSLDPDFAQNLKFRISRKLSYLFDKHYIKCDTILPSAYKKREFVGQGYKCV